MKIIKEGPLSRMMCKVGKHRVIKFSAGAGDAIFKSWACARRDCEWSKKK